MPATGAPISGFPETPSHIWIRLSDSSQIKRRLRISLADGCNLNCFFCHNEGQGQLTKPKHRESPLTPDEIGAVVRVALDEGVSKVKLTGGEPLLYRSGDDDVVSLVRRIASLRAEGYAFDLSVTTNGTLMTRFASQLR
jgi:cyclic pyranopterin phosphate synthase